MPCCLPRASRPPGGDFSGLVFRPQRLCPLDVGLLSLFRAAAEQDDQLVAIRRETDAITRPPIDAIFGDGAEPFHSRRIAKLKPQRRRRYLYGCLRVKTVEPSPVGVEPSSRIYSTTVIGSPA